MNLRYLRNTAGDFVAFAQGDDLFTPTGDWLGVIRGGEVWDPFGEHIGMLWADGRLVRNRAAGPRRSILKPKQPLRPVRPLPPKQGLFLPAISLPEEDVFQGLVRPLTGLMPLSRVQGVGALQGAALVAQDGAFLGIVSRDWTVPDSIAHRGGAFGDPASERSVFNARGPYGSADSPLSAWAVNAAQPPRVERDGEVLGVLSVAAGLESRIDPNALVAWLALR